jgi:putative ATP-binding cassette transporter
VVYEHLTLVSPSDKRLLVKDLNLTIPHGLRVLVTGADDAAKDALFKATAGIYDAGTGLVKRPTLDRILFLPERPYLPPGTLREALINESQATALSDQNILDTLTALDVVDIVERAGGLDEEHDWDSLLTPHEQRFVSFARILLLRPRFAVLSYPIKDLDVSIASKILSLLAEYDISLITMGRLGIRDGDDQSANYDAVLELKTGGAWNYSEIPR